MAYIYDLTDTWNAGGTTFNAIKMNVTDSASASASKLVTLQTNGTEHFSVTKGGQGYFSGNVGIGTATPDATLHVQSGTGQARVQNTTSGTALIGFRNSSTTDVPWVGTGGDDIRVTTQSAERMRITAAGNVGIGTSSPAQKLSVNGNIVTIGEIALSGSDFVYSWAGGTTGQRRAGFYLDGSNQVVRFYTAQNEVARIDSSGNLLVGTTSAPLAGVQGVQIGTTGFIRTGVAATTAAGHIAFHNPNGEVGLILTSGTSTAYNTSSDYRLKDIDGPIANSGAYIDALKPVQGSWKADGSRFIGLLAHEVQEVSETPIATGEKNGEKMQAMDYSAPEIIANPIAELQSLRARVAQLEGN
jgi:hypothetical protein